jgi:dienelactone hydrolase
MGSQNEHGELYRQTRHWVLNPEWKDAGQNFDYAEALQAKQLAPTLLLTGAHDWVLGNPKDVARLKREMGDGLEHQLQVYGKEYNHSHNYGHIDLLTSSSAVKEVFPNVLEWFQRYEK